MKNKNKQSKPKLSKSMLFVYGACAVGLFIILGTVTLSIISTARLNSKLDAIRATGYPATLDELNDFYQAVPDIENAAKLNEKISGFEELGKQYQIGHTFFAEIINVAKQFYGRERYFNKVPLFKKNGPMETLWNISIEPMLHAFFGNFDETQKNEYLSEMKEILFDGKK